MKSTPFYAPYSFVFLKKLKLVNILSNIFVTTTAVNILAKIPIIKVTANPLMGPDPN
jgi:hypothetical protein